MLGLNDDFTASGSDLKGFLDTIEEMDVATTIEPILSSNITIFSLRGKRQGEDMASFIEIPAKKNLLSGVLSGEDALQFKNVRLEKIIERGGEKVVEELIDGDVGMMFKVDKSFYFLSRNILNTLLQRVGMGEAIYNKSSERDIHLAQILADGFPVVLVKRNVNGVRKVFSIFTDRYVRIKQSTLGETINLLDFEKPMGQISVNKWTVTNSYTEIYIDFPNSDLYMPDLVPGVLFKTSDVGYCSTKAVGYWRTKDNKHFVFMNEGYCQGHRDGANEGALTTFFYSKILGEYEEFFERMKGLESQPVDKSVEDVLKNLFKTLDFNKTIGKNNSEKAKASIINMEEHNPSKNMFDVFIKLTSVDTEEFKELKRQAYDFALGKIPMIAKSIIERIARKAA